jgi:hypothetical protein
MRVFLCAAVGVLLGTISSANAAPLKIINGRAMHMVIDGQRKAAVGLGGAGDGWRVTLGAKVVGVIELSDVTHGTPVGKLNVRVVNGTAALGRDTFTPGHAYAVKLRTTTGEVSEALIYLYPPKGPGKVDFGEEDGGGEGAVAVAEKGML